MGHAPMDRRLSRRRSARHRRVWLAWSVAIGLTALTLSQALTASASSATVCVTESVPGRPSLCWTQRSPATSPSLRAGAAVASDPASDHVVLFGGSFSMNSFNDTWTWDGTTWTRQNPAASPATGVNPAMAYDAATGSVVLFGGYTGRGPRPYHYHKGTWTWG